MVYNVYDDGALSGTYRDLSRAFRYVAECLNKTSAQVVERVDFGTFIMEGGFVIRREPSVEVC